MINYDSFSSDPEEFSEEDANLADVDDENYEVVDHHSIDESEEKPCTTLNGRDTINVGLFSKFYTPRNAPSDPVKPNSGKQLCLKSSQSLLCNSTAEGRHMLYTWKTQKNVQREEKNIALPLIAIHPQAKKMISEYIRNKFFFQFKIDHRRRKLHIE